MSKRSLAVAGVVALSLLLAACGSSSSGGTSPSASGGSSAAKVGKVGVILPDSASSARWETADRKYLTDAFTAAGVESDIQNAQGDKAKFATLCDQMINEGVAALMIVNLDSETGAACEKLYAALNAKGVDVLYDDTDQRPGGKFATADLIGIPWQILIGPRGLAEGKVEIKRRSDGSREFMSLDEAINRFAK